MRRAAIACSLSRAWYSAKCARRRLTRKHIGGCELPAASSSSQRSGYASRSISVPPPRVLVPCLHIGADPRLERSAFAEKTAQQRVDVAFCTPALGQRARAHRLVDDGIFSVTARFERVERAP